MNIIRNGNIEKDSWVQVSDDESIPKGTKNIVSYERWNKEKDSISLLSYKIGIRLRSDQHPSDIIGDLEHFNTIALEFPQFKDGRPFSYARILRDRYKFAGDIRAFGHILRDQFLFLDRCGVNVLQLQSQEKLNDWTEAINEISVSYQPASDDRKIVKNLRRKINSDFIDDVDSITENLPLLEERLKSFTLSFGHLSSLDLLKTMIHKEFLGKIALVSSFGTEAAVLIHMISTIDKSLPIVFLDTGKLFDETIRYRDSLIQLFSLTNVESVKPEISKINAIDPDGILWKQDHDACCNLRKVEPLRNALLGFDAWITGRKRYQGSSRSVMPTIEIQGGRIKINPLASWTRKMIEDYFIENDIPKHPLEDDGFQSVGCIPCTDRIRSGEGLRDGRWRDSEKTECGIHESLAGQSLTSSEL